MLRDYDVQDYTNYEEVIQIISNLNKKPMDVLPPSQNQTVIQPHEIGYNSMTQ